MEEMNRSGKKSYAAMKSGMNRRTASKYLELGKLPSEIPAVERTWRTRQDPFEAHWPEVKQRLEDAPELEAKILFEHLCETYLPQCSTIKWMSLTARWRVPHPVRPKPPIWLQGTLILSINRDLVIPDCQSRTSWTGDSTSYAGLQKAYDCIR